MSSRVGDDGFVPVTKSRRARRKAKHETNGTPVAAQSTPNGPDNVHSKSTSANANASSHAQPAATHAPSAVRPTDTPSAQPYNASEHAHSEMTRVAAQRNYQIGRAPWYTETGTSKQPIIIGVAGGTASGKTTVCNKVVSHLSLPWVCELSMDRYYKGLTPEQMANVANYNFDHPDAFDWDALLLTLSDLKQGKKVEVPIYDFSTHSRLEQTDVMYGADIIFFEGIFALYDERVRKFLDMKIFVDTDADLRLARRLRRDIVERGRTVDNVLNQYTSTVKPSFDDFIAPTKRYADIIIPWSGKDHNHVALDLLIQHVQSMLAKRASEYRAAQDTGRLGSPHPSSSRPPKLELPAIQALTSAQSPHIKASQTSTVVHQPAVLNIGAAMGKLPEQVIVLERSNTMRHIHTVIRDRNCSHEDFQEFVQRLSRLVLARALDFLPSQLLPSVTVSTPTNASFTGVKLQSKQLSGVAIVRGGKPLQQALQRMLPDITLGDVVIQQGADKREGPRLYYSKLSDKIAQLHVILMDALVATANNVLMAIHVLLDHDVRQENITFVCLLATPQGLHALTSRFPMVRVVTSWVDEGLDGNLFATPGLGAFGNRYYGEDWDYATQAMIAPSSPSNKSTLHVSSMPTSEKPRPPVESSASRKQRKQAPNKEAPRPPMQRSDSNL